MDKKIKRFVLQDNDVLEGIIDILVEDFTLDELKDREIMLLYLKDVMGILSHEGEIILDGAIEIKELRKGRSECWEVVEN